MRSSTMASALASQPHRRVFLAILAASAIALLVLAWALGPAHNLEIRAGREGRLLRAIPVTQGERIIYQYTHSVQKGRIAETLEVASDHLVVRETTYNDFGAGLPSDLPDGKVVPDPATGGYRVIDMDRPMPSWPVRVAFTAQQTLEVRGESLRLDSLASPTTLLVVDVASRPRITTLFQP